MMALWFNPGGPVAQYNSVGRGISMLACPSLMTVKAEYQKGYEEATEQTKMTQCLEDLLKDKQGKVNTPARLHIPVFRNLFFGPKKLFLPGFLRIYFFPCVFRRKFSQERGFGGGCRNSCFLPLSQEFFAGIPVGQEFLYLLRIPPDSSGFLRIPPDSCSCQSCLTLATSN
jgi:hypothetical protein